MDLNKYYLLSLRFLNIRSRSEKEIKDYLEKKQANQELIDLVINKLKQQKFLNDEEFAKMWVRSRNTNKPKGKYVIRLELKQKGIAKEIIDEVLLDNAAENSELTLAIDVLERKRSKYQNMEKGERFNKVGLLLARRGFDLDTIKKAIDEVFGK